MSDDAPSGQAPPGWWAALWTGWGGVNGAVVCGLDDAVFPGLLWVPLGLLVGWWGWRVARWFSTMVFDWYRPLAARLSPPVSRASDDSLDDVIAESCYQLFLVLPPTLGIFHGTLIGPLVGAL